MLFMPFKHNSARRHRIPKMKYKVTNWSEYEAGLRQRGSVTFWLSDEALAAWHAPKRKTRGGQPRYSDLAIEASLKSGLVFDLPLRPDRRLPVVRFQADGCETSDPGSYDVEPTIWSVATSKEHA
ncbi:hypothetical protein B5P45_03800 [Phyllobacterium zundukense]|uniref:Transposase DDE domain-containing protein n=1 Tax=Phyllobacterium zundukense TaxID=1867719 RepID=A0A2N9W317_9HYPH|nr:hypothetical protein BLM14_21305 [Phyllobacterium zundukense]PIO46135.1 hypothetical protein B5P45_03800 [Phyllobacterium zundukense]